MMRSLLVTLALLALPAALHSPRCVAAGRGEQVYPYPGPGRQAQVPPSPSVIQAATFSGFSSTSAVYTFPGNVTSGNTVMFFVAWPVVGQTVSITDTRGITFTQQASVQVGSASEFIYLYSGIAGSTGPETITYTLSFGFGGSIEAGQAYELTNVGTPFLDSGVGTTSGTGGTITATSAITPGHADNLHYSVFFFLGTSVTLAIASPFTIDQTQVNPINPSVNGDAFATTGNTSPLVADWSPTTGSTGTASWAGIVISIHGP